MCSCINQPVRTRRLLNRTLSLRLLLAQASIKSCNGSHWPAVGFIGLYGLFSSHRECDIPWVRVRWRRCDAPGWILFCPSPPTSSFWTRRHLYSSRCCFHWLTKEPPSLRVPRPRAPRISLHYYYSHYSSHHIARHRIFGVVGLLIPFLRRHHPIAMPIMPTFSSSFPAFARLLLPPSTTSSPFFFSSLSPATIENSHHQHHHHHPKSWGWSESSSSSSM